MPAFVARCSIVAGPDSLAALREPCADVDLPAGLAKSSMRRQVDFLAGRYCAREAIRRLGCEPAPILRRDAAGLPAWPQGLVGSITHSGGFASAAVAMRHHAVGLGIDAEAIMSRAVSLEIADLVATRAERAAAEATGFKCEEITTLLFSAKESVFKCLHPLTACLFSFLDLELFELDEPEMRFSARLLKRLSDQVVSGAVIRGAFAFAGPYCHTGVVLTPSDLQALRNETSDARFRHGGEPIGNAAARCA